jgi:hypothetical protein
MGVQANKLNLTRTIGTKDHVIVSGRTGVVISTHANIVWSAVIEAIYFGA